MTFRQENTLRHHIGPLIEKMVDDLETQIRHAEAIMVWIGQSD